MRTERFDRSITLFDGEEDHRLPSLDISLLRSRIFPLVGKLMSYLGVHSGHSFLGLSPSAVGFITMKEGDSDEQIEMTLEDIPDVELRHKLESVRF
jgi:hypothetical protein